MINKIIEMNWINDIQRFYKNMSFILTRGSDSTINSEESKS